MEGESSLTAVCEINVTPMVDVLLSLLIIFMVAAPPPPNHKQPISLPKNAPVESIDDPEATLLLEIAADGALTLGKTPMPRDYPALVAALRESEKAQADGRIAVRAANKVPYGQVIRAMAAAREAGIANVGVASERL